ncbi:helix-turn-helix domain-containing protein [Tychonema sp. LEGE 06208]|uniref:helix-turn-helix domain-containing protein n=1 Tax=Tychonema sp. LEGE 06208 TaxID=1828663 RepID=UPI001880383C|nr:helix-turn-helix transcriptional regulator [Tychonema sp. LEGE 06208]MBE9161363.1 helix-turn-helix transcriptional regulator [Tychonema sp. LEGE 06208]
MSKTFGQLIRQARQGKGFSQRDLAKLVKVDYTYLSKLENDRAEYPPKEEVIQSLAHQLELELKELRDLAGRITPEDAKVVQDLVKRYPKQIPFLLRQMRDNPELAKKFIQEAKEAESEEKQS